MDKVNIFSGTHEKGVGVAGVADGSGQAESKGDRKKYEKTQSDVVVLKGS